MYTISLENMQFFAFHGHYEEEKITGNPFEVNLFLDVDDNNAGSSDTLTDALNYQTVYEIVKKEMGEKSNLLEHVATRIIDALHEKFPNQIQEIRIKVSKINPAMRGQIGKVSVSFLSKKAIS